MSGFNLDGDLLTFKEFASGCAIPFLIALFVFVVLSLWFGW